MFLTLSLGEGELSISCPQKSLQGVEMIKVDSYWYCYYHDYQHHNRRSHHRTMFPTSRNSTHTFLILSVFLITQSSVRPSGSFCVLFCLSVSHEAIVSGINVSCVSVS